MTWVPCVIEITSWHDVQKGLSFVGPLHTFSYVPTAPVNRGSPRKQRLKL